MREVRIQSLSYFTGFRVKTPSASIEYIVELDYVRLTRLWRDLIKGLPQLAGISSGYSCWLNLNSIRPCISSLLCSKSSSSFCTFPNGILNSFLSPLHDENPGHAWHFSSPKSSKVFLLLIFNTGLLDRRVSVRNISKQGVSHFHSRINITIKINHIPISFF